KTLGFILLPSHLLIEIGLFGLAALLFTRFVAAGRLLVAASIGLLAICGFSPVGNLLLYPLESRFPPWNDTRGVPDGILVLGGAVSCRLAHGWPSRFAQVFPFLYRRTRPGRYRSARMGGSHRLLDQRQNQRVLSGTGRVIFRSVRLAQLRVLG